MPSPSRELAVLLPPLFEEGRVEDFTNSGYTLKLGVSPRDDSVAVYATSGEDSQGSSKGSLSFAPDKYVYFAAAHDAPSSERRVFVIDTYMIFLAMKQLIWKAKTSNTDLLEDDRILKAINKLALDYVNHCRECCAHCAQPISRAEPLQFDAEHYRQLSTCFSLFSVLYLPEPGYEHAAVGDELMEWLNIHYVEPTTEEGDHLSSLDRPWEDEAFWPYITRSTIRGLSQATAFFLDVLSNHPSTYLQQLIEHLTPLLTDHPRLHRFTTEREYAIAARRWKDKVKSLRLELDRVPEEEREDGFENWWDRFSDIVGILEGREEVLKRVCLEMGADWKEVCVAWGIFVDTRLRRHDIAEVAAQVLDEMPCDPTNPEEMVHSALFLGKPREALAEAARLDVWLAAHLVDIMQAMQLIDHDVDDSELSLRDHYILSYAEYLRSNPSLWRHTVEYLCTCGDIGKAMADEVLMRVPLRLQDFKDAVTANEESASIRAGNLVGVPKEVIKSCFEHKREEVRRMVCRIAAQTFVKEKEYGLAVSYCASAEDWPGLGHVIDRILEDYIVHGSEQFARLVANIAPSLQALRSDSGVNGVFIYRLRFAVRFAEFHHHRLQGDLQDAAFDLVSLFREEIAPTSWWAVVLSDAVALLQNSTAMLFSSVDACLLMHKLEEIHIRTAQGSNEDYLAVLARTTKSGDQVHALQRLQTVRVALARYYAKCGVIRVGGRTALNTIQH